MVDIELVVKIPERVYNALTHTEFDANLVVHEMRKSIANGTLLPKGHGRLIDEDQIIKKMEEREEQLKDDRSMYETACVETALDMFGETIIEADKTESEEENEFFTNKPPNLYSHYRNSTQKAPQETDK